MFNMRMGLTFADILLIPSESDMSRHDGDVSTQFVAGIPLETPFIVSPMMQMRSLKLAVLVMNVGGGFILDRFFPIDERVKFISDMISMANGFPETFAAAIGIKNGLEDAEKLHDAGVNTFAIDVAHGARPDVYELIEKLKAMRFKVIGGNVVTQEGAEAQLDAGVDALRVGFGNGSICLTRKESGFGVPQYTAICDVYEALLGWDETIPIISDGGIVEPGDVVKAIHAGASAVMLGRQFAACPESAAEVVQMNNEKMKVYFGMASNRAADALGVDRFLSEGVENSLISIGPASDEVITDFVKSLKVGMAYGGSRTLSDLRRVAAMTVTANTSRESGAHDVWVIK